MGGNDHRPFFPASPPLQHRPSVPKLLRLRAEGRCQVGMFAHLMHYGTTTTASSSSRPQNWKLSVNKRIQSPVVASISRSSRPWTTALDLSGAEDDARFLLTGLSNGTVSIHDFGEQDSQPKDAQQLYRPLQQAETRSSSISSVQWYTDTGIFLTASTSGSVLLWDTEAMTPVLESQPFQFNNHPEKNSCHCMKMSPFSMLAATGSNHSPLVKLVDLKSGASSHSLTPPNHKQGVTAVQWFPHNQHILASCAGTVVLWDIRRPKLPLTVLDEDHRPVDASVSTAFQWDGTHWGRRPRSSKLVDKKSNTSSSSSTSHTTATNLAFASHHLVTLCARRRNLQIWDLRYSPAPVLLNRRYVDENNGKPLDQGWADQPLTVTGHCVKDRTVWIAKGHNLHGYSMFANLNGKPDVVLRGHLGRIQAVATNKQEQLLDSPKIVTASRDRLVLVWERQKEEIMSSAAAATSRKRRIDQDSW